jgi:hypothetical protein
MGRRLGMDVFEREHIVVFKDFLRRNLAANDAAEKAVGSGIAHKRSLGNRSNDSIAEQSDASYHCNGRAGSGADMI